MCCVVRVLCVCCACVVRVLCVCCACVVRVVCVVTVYTQSARTLCGHILLGVG